MDEGGGVRSFLRLQHSRMPSALGTVPAVILAGRDRVAMEVRVPDDLIRGNAYSMRVLILNGKEISIPLL